MNFGYHDLQQIIFEQVKKAGFRGGISFSKFAKDTAKLQMEFIREQMVMDAFWEAAHDFPENLDSLLKRLEKGLGYNFGRDLNARIIATWLEKQEKEGQSIERFCEWATAPDRKQYVAKYVNKPEYIKQDWSQAFIESNIKRNNDGSLYV